ncbi:DUF2500 domain-containing protein [Fictibacillus sp. WQ 8-8]|uniref:DUF2500 domain-containing protein n=1 Tax=Fictibacillus sp. WQ 8-8 TaxID=2938788 RepID=UPI00210D6B8E|nr:DUF2500 domain-containing protein [Fictibacillus sp. WQ 8-8]MCQ6268631.1 DUF2500 domain-containing protein [Fictibacillus sp. WQ 8-8]
MFDDPAGDFMFQFGPIFIGIVFVIVISVIIIGIVSSLSQWNKNNNSPKLSVKAKVVTKRTSIRGGGETSAHNDYYVTFQVESGDRMELEVKGDKFGMLVEGDTGELSFQGSRFLGFSRDVQTEIH